MTVKIGLAEGVCTRCGRTWRAPRPTDLVICDCYKFCPNCTPAYTVAMDPYAPDLTPSTYGPIESDDAIGDTDHPMKIIMQCPICKYYSSQLPVEVILS